MKTLARIAIGLILGSSCSFLIWVFFFYEMEKPSQEFTQVIGRSAINASVYFCAEIQSKPVQISVSDEYFNRKLQKNVVNGEALCDNGFSIKFKASTEDNL